MQTVQFSNTKKLLLLTFAMLALSLSACTPDANEQFIQGTWRLAAPEQQSAGRLPADMEWQFNNGAFTRQIELDAQTINFSHGGYRIASSTGDRIILILFDIRGERFTYENNDVEITIQIDQEQGDILVDNWRFERINP